MAAYPHNVSSIRTSLSSPIFGAAGVHPHNVLGQKCHEQGSSWTPPSPALPISCETFILLSSVSHRSPPDSCSSLCEKRHNTARSRRELAHPDSYVTVARLTLIAEWYMIPLSANAGLLGADTMSSILLLLPSLLFRHVHRY